MVFGGCVIDIADLGGMLRGGWDVIFEILGGESSSCRLGGAKTMADEEGWAKGGGPVSFSVVVRTVQDLHMYGDDVVSRTSMYCLGRFSQA